MTRPKPILLIILDGFGISLEKSGNPLAEARMPHIQEIEKKFPFTTLQASGVAVGLPWGEAGNSEVGHFTIGAGKVIYHHLPRIIYSIHDGTFFKNEAFLKATQHVKQFNSRLHIAGLISSGSVHSYIDHLYALLELTKQEGIESVFLHIFTDGKDAPPEEGAKFFTMLGERIKKEWPHVRFGSVVGRYYALDRDEKWDRIQTTYDLLTDGVGAKIRSIPEYLRTMYVEGITDEFIKPAFMEEENGETSRQIQKNDALIFSDFREDSMREITRAFVDDSFDYFPRKKVDNLLVVTMTEYQKGLRAHAAFPTLNIVWPLSRVLGDAGLRHLHIAETQKYAHVTYFFNGGTEQPFGGEERILIPSIPTTHVDEMPKMRAEEITGKILENFDRYDFIVANFANTDMVGHTGNFKAAVEAAEVVDEAIGKIMNMILENPESVMLITGDHGNIELKRSMLSGEKLTEHSINPVPLYCVGKSFEIKTPRGDNDIVKQKKEVGGILTDIAPTIIELLALEKPQEMTGKSLLSDLKKQS